MNCIYCGRKVIEINRTFDGNIRSETFDYVVIKCRTFSALTVPSKHIYVSGIKFRKMHPYNKFFRNKKGFQCYFCDKFYSSNIPSRYNSIIVNKKILIKQDSYETNYRKQWK
jgi:hypothetical protein